MNFGWVFYFKHFSLLIIVVR